MEGVLLKHNLKFSKCEEEIAHKRKCALLVDLDCFSFKGILDVHCGDIYFMFFI